MYIYISFTWKWTYQSQWYTSTLTKNIILEKVKYRKREIFSRFYNCETKWTECSVLNIALAKKKKKKE